MGGRASAHFRQTAGVDVLWRILGLHALAELGARLPAPLARACSLLLLIASNLLPLVGVLAGWMSFADVFVLYWLESVMLGAFAVVRIATALGNPDETRRVRLQSAALFLVHYGVVVALVGLFIYWAVGAAVDMGTQAAEDGVTWLADPPTLAWGSWLWAGIGIFLSHLFTLVVYWFGRGERHLYSAWRCMWTPYPRILVLYPFYAMNVVVLVVLVLFAPVLLVVLLVACKLTLDILLFALDRFLARRRARADRASERGEAPVTVTR